MKILFLCLKVEDSGLEIVPLFNSYFYRLPVGQFLKKSLIIAHRNLSLDMLEGLTIP